MYKLNEIWNRKLNKFILPQPESVKIKKLTEATQTYLLKYKKIFESSFNGMYKPAATFVYPCIL